MRKFLLALCVLLATVSPAAAQLGSAPYTFTAGTTIRSAEVNAMFTTVYANSLNRTGGTMTGSLTIQNIVLAADSTYDIGTNSVRVATGYFDAVDVTALTITSITCTGCVTSTNVLDGTLLNADINASAAIDLSKLATSASSALAAIINDETGSGALVFATSPTLVTPDLGTPSSVTLTNATGLPISTGVSGLGTGVATALAVNIGSAGAPVLFDGAGGTPSSITLTNGTSLPESGITDGSILARLAANETVTGAWTFNGGYQTFQSNASAQAIKLIGRAAGGQESVVLFTANDGTTQLGRIAPHVTNGFTFYGPDDTSTLTITNTGVTMSETLAWGGGSAISSSNAVALLADNETVTGSWTFNETITLSTANLVAGGTIQVTAESAPASGVGLELTWDTTQGNIRAYSRTGSAYQPLSIQGSTVAINTSTNGAVTMGAGTLAWGGGSAISSSSNVALLNAANTFSANRQTITANASAEALYILGRSSDDTSQVNFRNNANNANTGYIVAASTVTLAGEGTGGLSLLASNGSGDVRIYSRNALALTLGASQAATFNGYIAGSYAGGNLWLQAVGSTIFMIDSNNDSVGEAFYWRKDTSGSGGTQLMSLTEAGDLSINATSKLYLDGGSDTYIYEPAANTVRIVTGGSSVAEATGNANWYVYNNLFIAGHGTTASAANAFIDAADNGKVLRSTSSLRWKHDVQDVDYHTALDTIMGMRSITYRGKTDADQRRYAGFIAEEVMQINPLLATYDEGGESGTPNYVTYDRVPVYLVPVVQQHQIEIAALKAEVSRLAAIVGRQQ